MYEACSRCGASLPQPFQASIPTFRAGHRQLDWPVPGQFEAFYRGHLRFVSGGRIRAQDLYDRFAAWAREVEAPSLNMREIKRCMLSAGHRCRSSNGMRYFDVQFVEQCPDLADNFPAPVRIA